MPWRGRRGVALGTLAGVLGLLIALIGLLSLDFASPRGEAPVQATGLIGYDRFSARHEWGLDGRRLTVSLRLWTSAREPLRCWIHMVARNDDTNPKLWTIWPKQPVGPAITSTGHFHGAVPRTGHALTLTGSGETLEAVLPNPTYSVPYESVTVYVMNEEGVVLLRRPFPV